ncbi:hypothetical protein EK21DRAFT_85625 [Setomelanomma holmii]|uniref:Uncharacterized protein n=1 Tax=Setomelanomma holmii TaxID=210430 RepID=A0A9P4HFG0_9PLEO|nr:hypothetical protein EK21DRAFT_85625 [Setomelanomma holmii]
MFIGAGCRQAGKRLEVVRLRAFFLLIYHAAVSRRLPDLLGAIRESSYQKRASNPCHTRRITHCAMYDATLSSRETQNSIHESASRLTPWNKQIKSAIVSRRGLILRHRPSHSRLIHQLVTTLVFLLDQAPGACGSCGGSGSEGRYITGGSYQFGNSFARSDGIHAINQFCRTHAINGSVLGPDGVQHLNQSLPWTKARVDYNTAKSGKVSTRAIFDIDNRISKLHGETDCNKNGSDSQTILIDIANEVTCKNWLGQGIFGCDVKAEDIGRRSSQDTEWKHGGTFSLPLSYMGSLQDARHGQFEASETL